MSPPAGIASGYALWLVDRPTSNLRRKLNGLIQEAAAMYETNPFQSHVTLLCDLHLNEHELRQRAANVASQMRPVFIQLERLGSSGTYFKQLYALVVMNDKLEAYRRLAEEAVGLTSGTAYLPHHSFVYGDLAAAQVNELGQYVARELVFPQHFLAQDLELWLTEGPVNEWRLIQGYPLFPRVD